MADDAKVQADRMRECVKGCPFPNVYTEMNAGADAILALVEERERDKKEIARLISANEHWHIRIQQQLSAQQNAQDAQERAEADLATVTAERDALLLKVCTLQRGRPPTDAEITRLANDSVAAGEAEYGSGVRLGCGVIREKP